MTNTWAVTETSVSQRCRTMNRGCCAVAKGCDFVVDQYCCPAWGYGHPPIPMALIKREKYSLQLRRREEALCFAQIVRVQRVGSVGVVLPRAAFGLQRSSVST